MSMYQGVMYAADPPEGVARDPDQTPNASVIIAVTAVVFPLATLSMFVRMYARIVLIKKVAFDDCEYTNWSWDIASANISPKILCYLPTFSMYS